MRDIEEDDRIRGEAEHACRAIADGGEVGHVPTAVGYLLDEYDRRGREIKTLRARCDRLEALCLDGLAASSRLLDGGETRG